MKTGKGEPVVVGWSEYVALPDWGIDRLRAKVDTGARSSALHVENVEEIRRGWVKFDVVLHRAKRDRRVHIRARVKRLSRVRSSSGHQERRYFVETTLRLGPVEKRIEVSLVDRAQMIHRMLLGRSALTGGPFLIDVDHRMLLDRHRKKRRKKTARGA